MIVNLTTKALVALKDSGKGSLWELKHHKRRKIGTFRTLFGITKGVSTSLIAATLRLALFMYLSTAVTTVPVLMPPKTC